MVVSCLLFSYFNLLLYGFVWCVVYVIDCKGLTTTIPQVTLQPYPTEYLGRCVCYEVNSLEYPLGIGMRCLYLEGRGCIAIALIVSSSLS
jgi:hypothetical protein